MQILDKMSKYTTELDIMEMNMDSLEPLDTCTSLLLGQNDSLAVLEQMYEDSLEVQESSPSPCNGHGMVAGEHNYAIHGHTLSESPLINEDVLLSKKSGLGAWDSEIDEPPVYNDFGWVDDLLNPVPDKVDCAITGGERTVGDHQAEEMPPPCPSPGSEKVDCVVNSGERTVCNHQAEDTSPPCPSLENIDPFYDLDVKSPDSTIQTCTDYPTRSRKRKSSGTSTVSDSQNLPEGSMSKNAIAARENRIKKKRYVEGLEKKNVELEKKQRSMEEAAAEDKERIKELEERNAYLENVLLNQSALSSLLGSLPQTEGVRLSIAGQGSGARKKRRVGRSHEVIPMSRGVCLHVDGQTASLEFCSKCAIMAKGGSPS